jgi:2-polyprenyl-3-methyl-5-hydroxy-6-metoxy-1,4-benzoquinol methylase
MPRYYQNADGRTTYEAEYSQKELDHKALEANLAILALKNLISNHDTPLSLLEFGCGEGFFLKQVVSQESWGIKGVDFSKFGIEKWNPELLEKCDFGDLYFFLNRYIKENTRFDICILRNVLEHVINPGKLLTDI